MAATTVSEHPPGGSSSSSNVRVGVRIRPLTSREEGEGGKPVLKVGVPNPEIRLGQRRFTYDAVFDAHVSQSELYRSVSSPLLKSFLDGYNATIMAYGQTGSGKTFTMGSEAHTELQHSEATGLIPRFMNDLFANLQHNRDNNNNSTESSSFEFSLQASFLEVYGEDVHDLLDPSRASLPLREDAHGGVVCAGLTHRSVSTAVQALQVLHEGTLNRTTAATLMNLTSSRSHAVFSIQLTQTHKQQGDAGEGVSMTSVFTFVDLAGSERMKKTGAEGERAREGIKINEGLLALGNVINALADDERLAEGKKVHVPYRQSKLTRLLQDALGGNSQTLFLACVSPSDTNASETLSTLHYANRARNIRNAPTQNVDANALEMQRLVSLVQVLETELVKNKFAAAVSSKTGDNNGINDSCDDENNINVGEMENNALFQRPDVMEYLSIIHSKAQERQASTSVCATRVPLVLLPSASLSSNNNNNRMLASPMRLVISSIPEGTPWNNNTNKSVIENFDTALLAEVNPDEEMAILDQLLELQNRDNEFDEEQKKDDAQLKKVEGELVEQQTLLLQLRDSLKVYHDMKGKYEALMAEVQNLEMEKAELAEQLENATVDPSKGCSKAIKRELEKVEKSLARARTETRKHREMYKKAEQEAKKCAVLERKITDLKSGRVNLIKKQKEAAARHREYTEAKTREIMALKRKDRKNEQRMSKMQTEIHKQKKNLDKRQEYCCKLSAKLKQTEAHLMKLLSLRQRELRDRSSTATSGGYQHRRRASVYAMPKTQQEEAAFAPPSEMLHSVEYMLEQIISETVEAAELKIRYEKGVAGYGVAMRNLVTAVKTLENARKNTGEAMVSDDMIRELEQSVEDLELKVELQGEELDILRMQLSNVEETEEDRVETLVKDRDAPTLRSILVGTTRTLVEVQLHHNQLDVAAQRNESVRRGLENEVESLNERVDAVTKDLAQTRALQASPQDPVERIRLLDAERINLLSQLARASEELSSIKLSEDHLRAEKNRFETELSETKERFALLEAMKKQHENGACAAEKVLDRIQVIWRDLGVTTDYRTEIRQQIENCLDDTCERKLEEAQQLKQKSEHDLESLQTELGNMKASLGMDPETTSHGALLERIDALRQIRSTLKPTFANAKERADKILKQVDDLCVAIGLTDTELADDLKSLRKGTSGHCNLSDVFLSHCEEQLSALRVRKSEMLVRNAELLKETFVLVSEMNLSENQILPMVVHSRNSRSVPLPEWWSDESAGIIARAVSAPGGIVRVACSFYNHLSVVNESLCSLSKGRRILSKALGDLVQRAQTTLLETVDGEMDASEAYASFHETLFRLPPLSKELIHACVSEVNALLSGVEDMTQSEIEALTVVWEALDVSASERGKFWGEVEDAMTSMQTGPGGPFDDVVSACLADGEEWVFGVVRDSTKSYRQLETRLFKLERIHKEVERLRTRQDAKSKIISLDSEVRILSAKLSEFELKQCNKQRLLTKKTGSSNLLKEERFRKEMQQKFASKLEQLAKLLKSWRDDEKNGFDTNLLSDEVRMLLENSDNTAVWVEKRTEFMHLRTVKVTKRGTDTIERDNDQQPPRKRQTRVSRMLEEAKTLASPRARPTNRGATPKSKLVQTIRTATKRKAGAQKQPTPARASYAAKRVEGTTPAKKLFSRNRSPPKEKRPPSAKKRLTLQPFGRILEQASMPPMQNEENDFC